MISVQCIFLGQSSAENIFSVFPYISYQRNGVVWEVWGKESDLLGSHCRAPKLCLWLELFIVRFTYRKRFTKQALKGNTNRGINRETKNMFCRLLSCNEQALPRF